MAAIFVSHSSRDNDLARDVKSWLVLEGYEQVFLDFDKHTGLRAGEDWERRLYREIERCHAVVLILTPNWLESKWCFVEFAQARALGKIVFPIVVGVLGGSFVAPEIQGVDVETWDRDGQEHLASRIRAISEEAARGFSWDRSRSPYPGINAFDREDAAIFFGRDPEIRELAERLEAKRIQGGNRILLVVGASGSGKSSLLRAGLLPKLERERRRWIVVPPFRPERDPMTGLAKALAECRRDPGAWRDIRTGLSGPDAGTILASVVDDLRVGEARDATLLVAVDQVEELFTVADEEPRENFLTLLDRMAAPDSPLPLLVVGTIRSDVLGEVLTASRFGSPFDDYPLRPMPLSRVPKVVEGPAGVHAVSLERGLAQHITADVASPEALPLLAFALRELHERFGADRRLTIADYERLGERDAGLSPIENAIRRRAEDVIRSPAPGDKSLAALKSAFVGYLVGAREDGSFVRRPARIAELPAAARPLIDRLAEARLLSRLGASTDSGDGGGSAAVEIAHEALLKAWPLLAGWLAEEREFLATKAQIGRALEEWRLTPSEQRSEALPAGLALKRAQQFRRIHPGGFTAEEEEFIAAGTWEQTKRRRLVLGLGLAAVVLLGAAVAPRLYAEYGKRTALACDLLAAEEDNNVNVPGVPFDKIHSAAAIPACETAVAADAENPRLVHNLGRALDAAGRFPEAVAQYRKAASPPMNFAWSQNNLGVLTIYGRGTPPDLAAGVALLRTSFEQGNEQAATNYVRTDFKTLVDDRPDLTAIVRTALVERALIPADAPEGWSAVIEAGIEAFKRDRKISDKGVSLRVLDVLGVLPELSQALARSRKS